MPEDQDASLPKQIFEELENYLKEKNIEKYSIDIKGLGSRQNYLGHVVKADVSYIHEDRKKHLKLVVKCAPQIEQYRKFVRIPVIYATEVHIYVKVFPALLQFQNELCIEKSFFPFAKLYKYSLEAPYEYLILEDMNLHGFIMKDRKSYADLNHCLLVMESYGKLHALSLALKDQKPDVFQNLILQKSYFHYTDVVELCKTVKENCEKVINKLRKQKEVGLIKKLESMFTFPVNELLENVSPVEDCTVFCHGDNWSNNYLYKYADSNDEAKPTDVCILDWQLSISGSPACDLSYFIFVNTSKSLREAHYDFLLKTYHDSLRSYLKQLKSDPDIFPYAKLLEHMKKFSKYGLMMSIIVLPLTLIDSADDVDWSDANVEEEQIRKIFSNDSKNDEHVIERMADVVRDFDKLGYFDD